VSLASKLEKRLYKSRFQANRFRDIQPFYYYYLIWKKLPWYTEDYVITHPSLNFNWLIREQLEYIRTHVDSFRVTVTGPEGCGKTILGLELAHLVRDWDGKGGRVHLTYGPEGFCRLFESGRVNDNDVVVADEMKLKYEGEGSKKIEWRLENIKTIIRKTRVHLIFISTELKQYFHTLAEFKICGKDEDRRETLFLIYLGGKLIGKAYVKIRRLDVYSEIEEELKDQMIRRVIESGGAMVLGATERKKPIQKVELVEAANLRDFIIENCGGDDKLKEILKGVFNGENQTSIGERIGICQYSVSERLSRFGKSRLGYLAEEYFRRKFNDKRKIFGRAPQGEPDVIGEDGRVYSIKCYLGYKNSQIIYIPLDCDPELKYCVRNNIPSFTLIFVNPIWMDGYMHYEINVNQPPNWVSFRKDGKITIG